MSIVSTAVALTCGLAATRHCHGQTTATDPKPADPASAWYSPLKDIPLGPGRLDVGVNLRIRYEHADNFDIRKYGTGECDDLLLFRSRLILDYRLPESARLYIEGQDARYEWSDLDRGLWEKNNPFYDRTELRQAFLEWNHIGGSMVGLKAGRQSISYGDRRVFGPGEWGNVGRYAWDAAKLIFDTAVAQVDVLYGQRVESLPSDFNSSHFPFEMFGTYAQFAKFARGELSVKPDAFYVVRYDDSGAIKGEHGEGNQETHSAGFYADGKWGKAWDLSGTIVVQHGTYGQDDVRAFGGDVKAGHTWDAPWKPRFGLEYAYASGDSDPTDGTHETFDGVFGAMDLYYGRMNMFSWKNLENYTATFGVQPAKALKIWTDYHIFRRAEAEDAWYWVSGNPARPDATAAAGKDLGHEVDVLVQWKARKDLDVFAGYSKFYAGDFMKNTEGGAEHADWVFFQAAYGF